MIRVFFVLWASIAAHAGEPYNFEGIAHLPMCSGSFVRFTSSRPDDPGLMLTNGHCTGELPEGSFVYNKELHPRPQPITLLKADGSVAGYDVSYFLIYATRTDTDLALFRMNRTYAEIESSMGVKPLLLSPEHPAVGAQIEILSGYWYKGYTCAVEAFVPALQEDQWIERDSLRYSRPGCDVIPGTSGSPVLAAGTRIVVGINNTKNEKGELCTYDNPCEIDDQGRKTATLGYAYAQETYQLYGCLNAEGQLDLSVAGCKLPH